MKKKTDKELLTFSLASFFNDMGSDMIYPIWPLFVTSFMGANMFVLGLIDGIGDSIVSLAKAFSGYLSDKTGKRKIFIWTGYFMAFFSRAGYALSRMWWHLIPFKILDRAGKIRGPPRDAIVADISQKNRGANFGIIRAMDNTGAIVGVIISLILVNFLSIKTIFLIAAIPALIATGLIFFFIKEGKRGEIKKRFSFNLINKEFKIFLLSTVFLGLATFSYSFLLIFAKEAGFALTSIPILYLIFTLIAAIVSYPAGRLSDKFGRKNMIFLSMAVYLLMLVGFIIADRLWIFILLFILYGLFRGIIDTVQTTYASDLVPKEFRATGIGSFQLINGLSALPSSTLAGLLWVNYGKTIPFAFAIISLVFSFAILIFINEKTNKKEQTI